MSQNYHNTAHLTIRKDASRKDGTSSILLRLKIAGRKKDITLHEYCPLEFWDEKKARVKRGYPDADKINDILTRKKAYASDILYRYKANHLPLTFEEFKAEFGFEITGSFTDFIESEIKKEIELKAKSPGTIKSYRRGLSTLKRYAGNVMFNQLTVTFLDGYEKHMRTILLNKVNTIWSGLKFVRTFNKRAVQQSLTTNYPFAKKKLKTEATQREFLFEDELIRLHDYYLSLPENAKPKRSLSPFLFCCYTGLRYSDVKALKYQDINNGAITIRMQKTKGVITIPLFDRAIQLLAPEIISQQRVFNVPCTQIINRNIKRACKAIKIERNISFHCSRHSFAIFALNNGVPTDVIQKLLGHRDLKTTQIYARMQDQTVKEKMSVLNTVLNRKFAEATV